jgi:hypothetical protein
MMLQIKTIMSVLKVITTSIAAHPIRLTVIISVLTFKSAVILYISTHTYLQNRILKILLSPIGANFELIPAHFENMGIFSCFFYSSLMNLLVQNFNGTCLESPSYFGTPPCRINLFWYTTCLERPYFDGKRDRSLKTDFTVFNFIQYFYHSSFPI